MTDCEELLKDLKKNNKQPKNLLKVLETLRKVDLEVQQLKKYQLYTEVKNIRDEDNDENDKDEQIVQAKQIAGQILKKWQPLYKDQPATQKEEKKSDQNKKKRSPGKEHVETKVTKDDQIYWEFYQKNKLVKQKQDPQFQDNKTRTLVLKKIVSIFRVSVYQMEKQIDGGIQDMSNNEKEKDLKRTEGEILCSSIQIEEALFRRLKKFALNGQQPDSSNLEKFLQLYKRDGQELITKLKPEDIAKKVFEELTEGVLTYEEIAQLKDLVFYSNQQRKELERKRLDAMSLNNANFVKDKMKDCLGKSDGEKCRFCQKMTGFCYDQRQTRAADEPMTRFMMCSSCGKQWRD